MTYTPKIRALFVGILAVLFYTCAVLYIDSGAGVIDEATGLVNLPDESPVLVSILMKGPITMSNLNPLREITNRVENYRKTKRASNRRDVTGEVETGHLKPKVRKKTVLLKYDPRQKKSKVMIVQTDESVLGPGREALQDYVADTKRLIEAANCPEKEMENLLNGGRFRKMSLRFYPSGIFQEDIEQEAAIEYYQKRAHGATVDRAFQAAKYKTFHVALDYYRLTRRYIAEVDCNCDQCYFGRPSECLNGVPVIRPQIDEIDLDRTLENGQLVTDLIALETPDKYQDWQWIMSQMALIYESCLDWRDVRIIDGLREGKTEGEIGSEIRLNQSNISRRLTAIGERFLSIEQ